MTYVQDVIVKYGKDHLDECLKEDINKGFGGEFVYLKPIRTDEKHDAASGFLFSRSSTKCPHLTDLAKGSGGDYRYVHSFKGGQHIKEVFLSETEEGDARTPNLNDGREGRSLYLCWNYE